MASSNLESEMQRSRSPLESVAEETEDDCEELSQRLNSLNASDGFSLKVVNGKTTGEETPTLRSDQFQLNDDIA
ncbi:uncharacterized protein LOC131216379 isoform X3 [Anopheles bellator]|uniref:uncharacterized protein LOC131216379 isoform X3 n=1 Tax=Anopheles bellator TaxID=139047 RepID=UPI002649090B|nr:uncharacterized protein LOC131216379 isoform X3 [Anopheles bellator]